MVPEEKVVSHKPKVAIMGENNKIMQLLHAEPAHTIM
jgi:aspartate 1-decarboxylase